MFVSASWGAFEGSFRDSSTSNAALIFFVVVYALIIGVDLYDELSPRVWEAGTRRVRSGGFGSSGVPAPVVSDIFSSLREFLLGAFRCLSLR